MDKRSKGKPNAHFAKFSQVYDKVVFFNNVAQCSSSKVKKSLDKGVDPNCFNNYGQTALHLIAKVGDVRVARVLVECPRTNINVRTRAGKTPLMNAALCSRRKLLQYLLDHGADPNLATDTDETALHMAARHGDLAMVFDLVRYGAKVNVTNIYDATPLSLVVVDHPCMVVAKFLLRKGARIAGNKIFPLLLECVLDCHTSEQIKTIDVLLGAGMDLDIVHPRSRMNCLHMAAIAAHIPLCKFLLYKGANRNALDVVGRTPYMVAEEHGHELLQTLLKTFKKRTKEVTVTWKLDSDDENDGDDDDDD